MDGNKQFIERERERAQMVGYELLRASQRWVAEELLHGSSGHKITKSPGTSEKETE